MRLSLLLLCVLLWSASASASPEKVIEAALSRHFPPGAISDVQPSPIAGLYQAVVAGRVFYVSEDGRHIISGRMLSLETRADLTEPVLAEVRLRALDTVPESEMIVFDATTELRHTITTFTDIDCPYCRKMHLEMAALNSAGIRVRYLLYPRAGVGSESHEKAVSVWCADDQQSEMTLAKSGQTPTKRSCANPIEQHMALAGQLGLRGTPFTITDTGRAIGGYVAAAELARGLDEDKASQR